MKKFHVAAGRPSQSPDKIEKEEQDQQKLRDILRESDEKAKQLFERRASGSCDSAENALRIASRKKEARY